MNFHHHQVTALCCKHNCACRSALMDQSYASEIYRGVIPCSGNPELYIWQLAKSMKVHKHRSHHSDFKTFEFFKLDQYSLDYLQWRSLETWSQDHFIKSPSWRFQVSSCSQRLQVSVTSLLSWNCQYCNGFVKLLWFNEFFCCV